MEKLNIEMADILEVDSVADTDQLAGFDSWDSLAILSLLDCIDRDYDVQLFNSDLENMQTLADIKQLIQSKK